MSPASRGDRPGTGAAWRPVAALEAIRARAQLLQKIRAYFLAQGVLEVETPILGAAPSADRGIDSLSTHLGTGDSTRRLYLQASPEFAMKRLLAAGVGSSYQITRVFRAGESGRFHNPEFSLLEWYRIDYDASALMQDIAGLLETVAGFGEAGKITYREAFIRWADCDALESTDGVLAERARAAGWPGSGEPERDHFLDFLFAFRVQPGLKETFGRRPVFVVDYPASQAALAQVNPVEPRLAERFELFIDGVELANGYHELTDPVEQRARFVVERRRRERDGQTLPIDEKFLGALEAGLPRCAGVALGLDRLLMLILAVTDIRDVLAFPVGSL